MLLRRLVAWLIGLLVVGPAVYQFADPEGGTMQDFYPVIADSMNPDFSGSSEPTYPIVLFHQHRFPTKDEERDERWFPGPRVVCNVLRDMGTRNAMSSAPAAMADCMTLVEPGIGWVHHVPSGFAKHAPRGVLASTGCGGTILMANAERVIDVPTTDWTPELRFLTNGSVSIDDTWFLRPGQSFKVEYILVGREFGDSDDRRVRVVLDYPGRWLIENTGEMPHDPVTGEPLRHAPDGYRNEYGEFVADVPVEVDTAEAILAPLLERSQGVHQLNGFRATLFDGRLTDLSLRLSTDFSTIEWYVAGRDAPNMRMLGRVTPRVDGGVAVAAFQDAFPDPLTAYTAALGDSLPVVAWWAPDHAVETAAPVPWSETWVPPTTPCDGECAFVWAPGPTGGDSWRRHPGPVVEAENALTLAVETVTIDDVQRAYFHRPPVQ